MKLFTLHIQLHLPSIYDCYCISRPVTLKSLIFFTGTLEEYFETLISEVSLFFFAYF